MKRILVLSDIHGNIPKMNKIIHLEENVDIVLLCGDITGCGNPSVAGKVLDVLYHHYFNSLIIRGIPGNLDSAAVLEILEKKNISVHGKGEEIEDIGIHGVGGSNPTPMNTSFEISEDRIQTLLENGYGQIKSAGKKILLSHAPPYGTSLDRLRSGVHVGSHAVTAFLEKNECDLCVCGHIHESSGEEIIYNTFSVNTGAVKNGAYSLIEFDNNRFNVERRHL